MPNIVDPQLKTVQRKKLMHDIRSTEPNCWLCGNPINPATPTRTPLASTIDEIIPRSLGGSATERANCRHAHQTCNSTRGAAWPVTDAIRARCKAAYQRHARQPTSSRKW